MRKFNHFLKEFTKQYNLYIMTRKQLIEDNKVWIVYPDQEPDNILFEGTETAARKYIRKEHNRNFKKGVIRIAKVIWESETIIS